MAQITVDTNAKLVAALKSARDGDVISLAPGDYGKVNLRWISTPGNVTIQSLDASRPAVFSGLIVRDGGGMTFRNLEFASNPADGALPFNVFNAKNVVFDSVHVHGTLNGNPHDDTSLMAIRNSANVKVMNSEFEQGVHGLYLDNSNNVAVTNNSFHDMRTDGVRGGGTSNLVISGNRFSDFHIMEGDHADAIQLWSTNYDKPATDISIANNIITRGQGDPIQGVFVRDTFSNMPFERLSITGNQVIGGAYNAIAVDGARGVTIADNNVVAIDGQRSWIRVSKVSDAVSSNNTANHYLVSDDSTITQRGNVLTDYITNAAATALSATIGSQLGATVALSSKIAATLNRIGVSTGGTEKGSAIMTITNDQILQGTGGADKLVAKTEGKTIMYGGDGNDTLVGGLGVTEMFGGDGDDAYTVRTTKDLVIEEADGGTDTVTAEIDYSLTANVEILRMAKGGLTGRGNALDNRLVGSSGNDTLYGEDGDDTIQGGAGNDRLYGGNGNDIIRGDDGNDMIYGDAGDDKLYGGTGDDIINGGAGNDWIEGGTGSDTLWGGAGADTFYFRPEDFGPGVLASMDHIMDFSSAQKDKINLSALDANSLTAANDKFTFIGTKAFGKVAGQLRYEVSGKDSYVSGDTNGDGVADFKIHVVGVTNLVATDFAL